MKIFFYINSLSRGGAERVMTNLAGEMSQRGYDCTLITTFRTKSEYITSESVKRYSLFEERPSSFFVRNVMTVLRLRQHLKKEKPDLLVTFMGEPNFRGIIATRGLPVKTVVSIRNTPESEYGTGAMAFWAKILFRFASFVVFQTKDAQEWFPCPVRKKSAIIFNPVDKIFYEKKREKVTSGIVTVGRLVPQKNHRLLIRAYAKVADRISEDLVIYGGGEIAPFEKYANSLGIGGRVHFPGQVSNISEVLANARIFVLSSDFEGMPNALMEAMAVGVPCISTDCPCGGPQMLFPDTIKSFLVPVGETDVLAKKLLQVLSDSKMEKYLAEECRKASRIFESSKVFDEWENCFREVCENENPSCN